MTQCAVDPVHRKDQACQDYTFLDFRKAQGFDFFPNCVEFPCVMELKGFFQTILANGITSVC